MTTLPFDNPGNMTTVVELIDYSNSISGYWFGWVILLAWFLVCLMALSLRPLEEAFTAASFLAFVGAVFLNVMALTGFESVILFLLMTGIGVFWIQRKKVA